MACSASSNSGATRGYPGSGGNPGPGGNGGAGANGNDPLPLIPCPYCGSWISTAISRKGTRPGTRYYKCHFFSTGQCSFFEWREGYAELVGATVAPAQAAAQPAAAPPNAGQLPRINLLVSVTNTLATLLVLAVVLFQLGWGSRN